MEQELRMLDKEIKKVERAIVKVLKTKVFEIKYKGHWYSVHHTDHKSLASFIRAYYNQIGFPSKVVKGLHAKGYDIMIYNLTTGMNPGEAKQYMKHFHKLHALHKKKIRTVIGD